MVHLRSNQLLGCGANYLLLPHASVYSLLKSEEGQAQQAPVVLPCGARSQTLGYIVSRGWEGNGDDVLIRKLLKRRNGLCE